jgi:hypothetical protein
MRKFNDLHFKKHRYAVVVEASFNVALDLGEPMSIASYGWTMKFDAPRFIPVIVEAVTVQELTNKAIEEAKRLIPGLPSYRILAVVDYGEVDDGTN